MDLPSTDRIVVLAGCRLEKLPTVYGRDCGSLMNGRLFDDNCDLHIRQADGTSPLWRANLTDKIRVLLHEALNHITTRTEMEASILKTARERLDVLEDDDGAKAVAEVCRLVEDCRQRHFALHGQLMTARNVFLDEQDRQAFHPFAAIHLPSLANDVLEPMKEIATDRGHVRLAATDCQRRLTALTDFVVARALFHQQVV